MQRQKNAVHRHLSLRCLQPQKSVPIVLHYKSKKQKHDTTGITKRSGYIQPCTLKQLQSVAIPCRPNILWKNSLEVWWNKIAKCLACKASCCPEELCRQIFPWLSVQRSTLIPRSRDPERRLPLNESRLKIPVWCFQLPSASTPTKNNVKKANRKILEYIRNYEKYVRKYIWINLEHFK